MKIRSWMLMCGVVLMAGCGGDDQSGADSQTDGGTGGETGGGTGGQTGGGTGGQTGGGGGTGGQTGGGKRVLFLHHSTGAKILGGGVTAAYKKLRADDTFSDELYPTNKYGGTEDPNLWVNGPQEYDYLWAGTDPSNPGARHRNQKSLDDLVGAADIIILKHCFTTGDMDADQPSSPYDFHRRLTNFKTAYTNLKKKLTEDKYKKTKFIFWTIPPRSNKTQSADNETFRKWVLNDWDEKGDNIFVFDYRHLVTQGKNDKMPGGFTTDGGHPSTTMAKAAAPCFAQRVADVANGDGDKAGAHRLTGGCDPASFGK